MPLYPIRSAWRSSRLQRAAGGLATILLQSKALKFGSDFLRKASLFFERHGKRLRNEPWQMPASWETFLVGAAVATLVVRGVILSIFGAADGRWLIPPGLCLLWLALGAKGMTQKRPDLWRASWTFRILSRGQMGYNN